jgi:hypothetical protein
MEARVQGGQGPESVVLPYIDGWNNALIVLDHEKAQQLCFYSLELQTSWQLLVCVIMFVDVEQYLVWGYLTL